MLCLADKKRVRTGAVELGKVLTPKSPLLRVLQAGKKRVRTGAVELGKMHTPESSFLHVMPSRQDVDDNRGNGTGKGAYPGELPPPCCAQQA
jgi:hypothetical protein